MGGCRHTLSRRLIPSTRHCLAADRNSEPPSKTSSVMNCTAGGVRECHSLLAPSKSSERGDARIGGLIGGQALAVKSPKADLQVALACLSSLICTMLLPLPAHAATGPG